MQQCGFTTFTPNQGGRVVAKNDLKITTNTASRKGGFFMKGGDYYERNNTTTEYYDCRAVCC